MGLVYAADVAKEYQLRECFVHHDTASAMFLVHTQSAVVEWASLRDIMIPPICACNSKDLFVGTYRCAFNWGHTLAVNEPVLYYSAHQILKPY